MLYYFKLQLLRFSRKITEIGIPPGLGFFLIIGTYLVASKYLFYKTVYAPLLYIAIGLFFVSLLSDQHREKHLSFIFRRSEFWKIRLIENMLASMPVSLYLGYEGYLEEGFIFLLIGILMSLVTGRFSIRRVIPTPFRRKPFELIVIFRTGVWAVLISLFLLYKGVSVENYNLGVSSIGVVFLWLIYGYSLPEKEYYVWVFSCDVKTFLKEKLRVATYGALLFCLIHIIVLEIYFSDKIVYTLIVPLLGLFLLWLIILGKYSVYPKEMNLPQALLIGMCFWFPPMVLIVLPIFYKRALKKMNIYLYD